MIGGGYEFVAPGTMNSTSPDLITRLAQAYLTLDYDLFVLAPEDFQALSAAGVPTAPSWWSLDDAPRVVTQKVPDGLLAFVLFPPSLPGGPSGSTASILANTATQLRESGQYNLIIGISTWGQPLENDFIANRRGKAFDIILGSGHGPSYPGLYLQDNAVLWVRPSLKGKGVNTIVIPNLPKAGTKPVWSPNVTVMATVQPLRDELALDPAITTIFAP